jgi:hypothetical protein
VATTHDDLFAAAGLVLHTVQGRPATWTKQSTGATTAVTVLWRVDGTEGVATLKAAALASAPTEGDYFVLTGATARWYVERVRDREGLDADYVLDVRSNAAE